MNVLNGGVHADNGLGIQEFMLVPAAGGSFSKWGLVPLSQLLPGLGLRQR